MNAPVAVPVCTETEEILRNLKSILASMQASIALVRRFGRTLKERDGKELDEIADHLFLLRDEAEERLGKLEDEWASDLAAHKRAVDEARAHRAVPGSEADLQAVRAAWGLLRKLASGATAMCDDADAALSEARP